MAREFSLCPACPRNVVFCTLPQLRSELRADHQYIELSGKRCPTLMSLAQAIGLTNVVPQRRTAWTDTLPVCTNQGLLGQWELFVWNATDSAFLDHILTRFAPCIRSNAENSCTCAVQSILKHSINAWNKIVHRVSTLMVCRCMYTHICSGLAWHTSDETLREGFQQFGSVEEAVGSARS